MTLQGRNIVLGVTGSIASYKGADLASKLTQAGALVDVIMTRSATEFVTPLTFSSLTHRSVVRDLFDADSETSVEHVMLAKRADAVIIAPATANVIAKIVHGLADDMLTATVLATAAPLIVAPAMDGNMFDNPATQQNLETLRERGADIVGPHTGYLASGLSGVGRLADTAEIIGVTRAALGRNGDLAGRRIVVTAGGTQEPIDPVRVITNRSSGKMGFALAEAARDRGAIVTLIAAPSAVPTPAGVDVLPAVTAREMAAAVADAVADADALIMAAAVADYESAAPADRKIKKTGGSLSIDLAPTPDILSETDATCVRVGFAAESGDLIANARKKLESKRLDLIVANDITAADAGFSSENNRIVIIDLDGGEDALPLMPKYDCASKILDRVATLIAASGGKRL